MDYIFIPRPGDIERIHEQFATLKNKSKQELVKLYNKQVQIGLVGVHAQAIFVVALHWAFKALFLNSPIFIQDNIHIKLSGIIELDELNWKEKTI